MKISKPYKGAKLSDISQGFHQEHQANDWVAPFGTFLVAPFNAKVIAIVKGEGLTTDPNPFKAGYGIRLQSVEDPTLALVYWHCQPVFPVELRETVIQGSPVAMMGNSGYVISGGKYVEPEARTKSPYPGTHVHITIGRNNIDGTYTPLDYSSLIDWTVPVTGVGILQAIAITFKKILTLLKK